jgi:hypothetical protein
MDDLLIVVIVAGLVLAMVSLWADLRRTKRSRLT